MSMNRKTFKKDGQSARALRKSLEKSMKGSSEGGMSDLFTFVDTVRSIATEAQVSIVKRVMEDGKVKGRFITLNLNDGISVEDEIDVEDDPSIWDKIREIFNAKQ